LPVALRPVQKDRPYVDLDRSLSANFAFLRSLDVSLHVLFEEEAIAMQGVRGSRDGADIRFVSGVPFLNRQPRIAGCQAVGLRSGEIDLLACAIAPLIARPRAQRPTGVGQEV
jgi:hypothetical protein